MDARYRLTRRRFVQGATLAGLGLLAGCSNPLAPAQPPPKVARIGWLGTGDSRAFRQGMRELGYVEGQHYVIEHRDAAGQPTRLPELAAELVRLPVDVIVTGQVPGTVKAAHDATSTIPIVIAFPGDPVAAGFVASLGRPGGNLTGAATLQGMLGDKRLELLKETLPGASRLAVLFGGGEGGPTARARAQLPAAAQALGVELLVLAPQNPEEYEEAFLAVIRERVDGLSVEAGAAGSRVVALAAQYQLPTMYWSARFVRDGGLMSYGASLAAAYGRAAYYVHRILQGTQPADLPIEQPTIFDFVINLKTAQALGLTIPQHVLLQVTEVIQ